MRIDDEMLSAYLDAELNQELSTKVEAELAQSPTLQARLQHLRLVDEEAKAFYKELDKTPMPKKVQAVLHSLESPNDTVVPLQAAKSKRTLFFGNNLYQTRTAAWLSIAASVFVLFGVGYFWKATQQTAPLMDIRLVAQSTIGRDSALFNLLEFSSSGETTTLQDNNTNASIVLTFVGKENQACREFILQQSNTASRNIACRAKSNQWEIQISTSTLTENNDMYIPAAEENTAAIDAAINALSNGNVLSADEELDLLNKQWVD